MDASELKIESPKGPVGGLALIPPSAWAMLVFGQGAGAGMRHRGMELACQALAEENVATLRYQFPYMERGGGMPDPKPVLLGTVRAAVEEASRMAKLPLFLGGRSMGGRMSSMAVADKGIEDLRGLVFYGFPLHPSGRPSIQRAEHLSRVQVPMLFLQGSKDTLAELDLLRPVVAGLGELATLEVFEGADHSFKMPKSKLPAGMTAEQALARAAAAWMKAKL